MDATLRLDRVSAVRGKTVDDDCKGDGTKESDASGEDDSGCGLDRMELAGRIRLRDDLDHRAMRRSPHDFGSRAWQWTEEGVGHRRRE